MTFVLDLSCSSKISNYNEVGEEAEALPLCCPQKESRIADRKHILQIKPIQDKFETKPQGRKLMFVDSWQAVSSIRLVLKQTWKHQTCLSILNCNRGNLQQGRLLQNLQASQSGCLTMDLKLNLSKKWSSNTQK